MKLINRLICLNKIITVKIMKKTDNLLDSNLSQKNKATQNE